MCEEFLISPEGRRLSVDESELQAQIKLPPGTLQQLVDRRLLRTDRRADATYYELSHDALVQPVLNSRRTQALAKGWTGTIFGALVLLITVVLCGYCIYFGLHEAHTWDDKAAAIFIFVASLAFGYFGWQWFSDGRRTRRRYRRSDPMKS